VPVVAETYDEVVFTNPTEVFFQTLERVAKVGTIEYTQQDHFTEFSDTDTVQALLEAQKWLQSELTTVKERVRVANEDLHKVESELLGISSVPALNNKAAARSPATRNRPASKKAKT
jgi:hypothetical protein